MESWNELVRQTEAWSREVDVDGSSIPVSESSDSQGAIAREIGRTFCVLAFVQGLFPSEVIQWTASFGSPISRFLLNSWFEIEPQNLRANVNQVPTSVRQLATKIALDCSVSSAKSHQLDKVSVGKTGIQSLHTFTQELIGQTSGLRKKQRGVFYTPQPIADFIVEDVVRKFESLDALPADFQVIDLAAGSGIFTDRFIENFIQKFAEQSVRQVANVLLPNLFSFELMLPASVMAHFAIANALTRSGLTPEQFHELETPNLATANTLALFGNAIASPCLHAKSTADKIVNLAGHKILIGNPPYRASSTGENEWIADLIHGRIADHPKNYFEVAGEKMGERKVWLHDDYVKFFRLAHWLTCRAGNSGSINLITNRGFLDNLTFRGMRFQLVDDFPQIQIVDLGGDARHGTSKKQADENVFSIETGVAIGTFLNEDVEAKHETPNVSSGRSLWYTKISGTRKEKLGKLGGLTAGCEPFVAVNSSAPNFLFTPTSHESELFRQGIPLDQVFRQAASAPVTARDHFVVAFTRGELEDRIAEFRDLSISEEAIRQKYFQNTRSTKYPPGDTRSFKLGEARKRVAADPAWKSNIRLCEYRVFDRRYVFWSSDLVDWPRNNLVQWIDSVSDNLTLIARRQSPEVDEYSYFWLSDQLPIDGILRSDNRGNETCFPLYTAAGEINFSEPFMGRLTEVWAGEKRPVLELMNGRQILMMIYGLFQSQNYRKRFSSVMRFEFPRVMIPRSIELARRLAVFGEETFQAQQEVHDCNESTSPTDLATPSTLKVVGHFPKWQEGKVWVAKGCSILNVDQSDWEFRIGSHQVLRKFLRDRRGRELSGNELERFRNIAKAISVLRGVMESVDQQIDCFGGLERAFLQNK